MGDPDTRERVARLIRESCPLAKVLVEDKPCPFYGMDGTCATCTQDWLMTADEVLKVAEIRRASYEKEHSKTRELIERVERLEMRDAQLTDSISRNVMSVKAGIRSLSELLRLDEVLNQDSEESEEEDGRDS